MLTYPISAPTTIGIESITLIQNNAKSRTKSPFSFQEQVFAWGGESWGLEATIPAMRRDITAEWKSFLVSLRGSEGTFLMGDPAYEEPRGTCTAVSITGGSGSDSIVVDSITGTLLAGDYIQLGSGSSAKLLMVLEDITSTGTYSIWPYLRDDYTSVAGIVDSPKGVFRLDSNQTSFSINSNSDYAISFTASEVVT